MATGNASAQNNVITAAEYQAAADEITAIINAQRAERAPIEAEQELLRNRQELLITRQQLALNTLRAAEADPGDTAFLEASRTAYARATGEVNATNLAIQQNRSVLAQSRQSTAELQEQRGRLEVNAEFADRGPPTQNSLPPPATVVPDQSATYVAPPAAPVLTQSQPDLQPEADIPPLAPASQNNVSTASQWFETETEITSASRSIRAENAATTQNLASLRSDYNQATQTDEALKSQIAIAQRSGASAAEIERLEERRGETLARTAELERQINRDESVLAQNQETLAQLDQQRFIAEEAQFAASSGTPGLNSVPPPATVIPDQPNTFYSPPEITYAGSFDAESVPGDGDEALQAFDEAVLAQTEGRAILGPAPVDGDPAYGGASDAEAAAINQAQADDAEISGAAALQAGREQQLRDQFTIQQRYNTSTQGDWRVRIRLAPGANYLYKAPAGQRGILEPLVASDGVIFPYTPTIQTSYQAKYDSYNLTHSNYRGYFYQGSQVGDISINGIFTAQDTTEAQYLLAVIHFFRSVTKMFYGKDQFRGAPPPSVELSGFGQYQFNNHPCLVASFNYSLPKDVDYIQIAPNNQGLNLGNRPSKVSSSPSSTLESVSRRLTNAGLPRGGQTSPTDLGVVTNTVNGTSQTTYVPTKVEIAITLHPMQTRQQVSQAFSLENFANGNLLKGGFW